MLSIILFNIEHGYFKIVSLILGETNMQKLKIVKFFTLDGMSGGKCYTCKKPVSYGVMYCEACRPK